MTLTVFIVLSLNLGLGLGFGLHQQQSAYGSVLDFMPGIFSGNESVPNPADFDPNGTLTAINSTWNNYTNPQYGFTFLIPSNWNQSDLGLLSGLTNLHSILFKGQNASKETGIMGMSTGPNLEVQIYTTAPYLDPQTMTLKNSTIKEFANPDINAMSTAYLDPSSSISYEITKNQPQGDAWRVDAITNIGNQQSSYTERIYLKDPSTGYLYKLLFSTDALDAPGDLLTAKKIIESFRYMDVAK
jgi:hypothetical protein